MNDTLEIEEAIKTADKPVIKVLYKTEHTKVIAVGLGRSVKLNDHKTNVSTQLLVLKGCISYSENKKMVTLNRFDQYEIPLDVIHAVQAYEDSIFLLIQST